MTLLRRFLLSLILLACVPFIHAPLIQAQSPSVVTNVNVTFTTIDVPGAGYTIVWGINTAGDMVGNYGQNTNLDSHGFLYRNGTFTYLDYPGEDWTLLTGINDSGLIVGQAGRSPVIGFVYDGTTFTPIRHGQDSATVTLGINNAGEVVGGTGTIYATRGFAMRNGRFKLLDVPVVSVYIYGSGVNNLGVVVGWTDYDSFMCRASQCRIFDVPGASKTEALGINDNGVIVGWYDKYPLSYGFARKNGKYVSFHYPGAKFTGAAGINNLGQVVGGYTFDNISWHGFVTNPIADSQF